MHKNAPTSILSCRLESKCDCVRILHSMVEVIAGRVGLDCVEANRLALAANELFANICSHGYKGQAVFRRYGITDVTIVSGLAISLTSA